MGFYSNADVRVPNRSVFNLSHRNASSFKFDKLYPTLCEETLPDDVFRIGNKALSRFAPMVSPSFGSIKMYNHYFYIPNRIVQPFWKNFWSEDQVPTKRKLRWRTYHANLNLALETFESSGGSVVTASASLTNLVNFQWNIPHPGVQVYSRDASLFGEKSLADYLGIPPLDMMQSTMEHIDLTPFLAYQFVYNEYYRDSEIEDDLFETPYRSLWWLSAEGAEEFLRCLQGLGSHDFSKLSYFVSGTNGNVSITRVDVGSNFQYVLDGLLPLTNYSRQATLLANPSFEYVLFEEIIHDLFQLRTRAWHKDFFTSARPDIINSEVPIVPVQFNELLDSVSSGSSLQSRNVEKGQLVMNTGSTPRNVISPAANVTLSNSGSSSLFTRLGFTISALRLANAIQKKEEKIMMFGKRYLEQLASRFGVISSDASLQRPLYLGGNQDECYSFEVTQTSESTTSSAQGNYAGQMVQAQKNFNKIKDFYVEEHGWILCLTSYLSETSYAQGLDRKFTREYAEDFYTPEFATLTDQQVIQKELLALSFDELKYRNIVNTYQSLGRSVPDNTQVFGYQGRWDEYRQRTNRFSGEMRDETSFWHFGRIFPTQRGMVQRAVLNPSGTTTIGFYMDADGNITLNFTGTADITTETNPYKVPVFWLSDATREALFSASKLDDFMQGSNVHVEVYIPAAEWVNRGTSGLQYVYSLLFPRVPQLLPSFIHSSVPTRSFAITDELHAYANEGNYIAGPDYINTDLFFEISAVRPMPENSRPKI